MSDQNPIFLIESNDFAAQNLRQILSFHGLEDFVHVVSSAPEVEDSAVIEALRPIRAGQLLDHVYGLLAAKNPDDDILQIGKGHIDVSMGLYYSDSDAKPIRLTEKEVALFVLLKEANGQAISRERLLEDVWQYADGVETHTLETHIYRLRQKIEIDPANPEILMTGESGYFLSLESV